jgi:TolA-binding protein
MAACNCIGPPGNCPCIRNTRRYDPPVTYLPLHENARTDVQQIEDLKQQIRDLQNQIDRLSEKIGA